MRKTILILAALAAVVCRAEPDDFATEAYAHFEATNEVEKAKAQIAASINTRCAQDRAYASSVASNALETAKSYADSLVVDVNTDSIVSNAVETTILIVDGRGYLLPSATNGLAKASYVDAKVMEQIDLWKEELGTTNYAPKSWVLSLDYTTLGAVQSYLASMDYASKGHVSDNYVSKAQLNAADYAQKTWVDSYIGEHLHDMDVKITPVYGGNGSRYTGEWKYYDMPDGIQNVTQPYWSYAHHRIEATFVYNDGETHFFTDAYSYDSFDSDILHFTYTNSSPFVVVNFSARKEENPIVGYYIGSHTNEVFASTNKTDSAGVSADTVTNIVRSANGGLWDTGLEVWWTPVMTNGCLIYKATTNVNMNAEVTP